MAITRFDKFLPRDYSMQWFTPKEILPNFEAWGKVLGEQQQKFDNYNAALQDKTPRYLQTEDDRQLYQQYKNLSEQAVSNVSNAYMKDGITSGNRLLKDYSQQIINQWKPGGAAAVLEDRYSSYVAAREQIDKDLKDEKNPVNKWYAYKQLEDQLKNPLNYNPETGEYSRIYTPEIYKDPNIKQAINDAVKTMQETGTTSIQNLDSFWIKKIQTEGKTPEAIAAITKALLQQPEFQKQVQIEGAYKGSLLDPDKAKEQYAITLNNELLKKKQQLDNLSKADKSQITEVQKDLIKSGYDISADGTYGPKTKQALDDWFAKQSADVKESINTFDPISHAIRQTEQSYIDYGRALGGTKTKVDLIFNEATALQMKLKAQRENTEKLLSGVAKMLTPDTGTKIATPGKGVSMDTYQKMKDNVSGSYEQAKGQLNKWLTSDAAKPLGSNPNTIASYMNAWQQSGGDPNKFKQLLRSNPDFSISGLNDQKVGEIADFLSSSGSAFNQAFTAYQEAVNTKAAVDMNDESLTRTYIGKEGREDFEKLKSAYMKPGESEADFVNAIVKKDKRFETQMTSRNSIVGATYRNAADDFLKSRDKVIKNSTDPDYPKSINSYTITSTNNDKAIGPLRQLITEDISHGDVNGYTSEGRNGIVWRDKNGNDVTDQVNNIRDVNMEMNVLGTMGAGYNLSASAKQGEKSIDVYATIDKVPVTHKDAVNRALIATKADAQKTGDNSLDYVATMGLAGVNGDINYAKTASQNVLRLHEDNTKQLDIFQPIVDASGNISGVKKTSEYNNPNLRGAFLEEQEKNGNVYRKYKVYNPKKSDSEQFLYTKIVYKNGQPAAEVQMLGKNGNLFFNTSDAIDFDILGKGYDTQIPTEMDIQRIPSGTFLNEQQRAALGSIITSSAEND